MKQKLLSCLLAISLLAGMVVPAFATAPGSGIAARRKESPIADAAAPEQFQLKEGSVKTTPAAITVTITGTAKVEEVLTAAVTTTSPAGVTVSIAYEWQRSATADGTYAAITGATNKTYTPVTGDVGKFIKVKVDAVDSYSGTATSAAVGPVATAAAPAGETYKITTSIIGATDKATITAPDSVKKGETVTFSYSCQDGYYTFPEVRDSTGDLIISWPVAGNAYTRTYTPEADTTITLEVAEAVEIAYTIGANGKAYYVYDIVDGNKIELGNATEDSIAKDLFGVSLGAINYEFAPNAGYHAVVAINGKNVAISNNKLAYAYPAGKHTFAVTFAKDSSGGSGSGSPGSGNAAPPSAPALPAAPTATINTNKALLNIYNNKDANVGITVSAPVVLDEAILIAAQQTGKSVTISVVDSKGELAYSWEFSGNTLTNPEMPANLKIEVNEISAVKNPALQAAAAGKSGIALSFSHDGSLPGPAKVVLNVLGSFVDGEILNLNHFNESTGKLELTAAGLVVENGKVTLPITHCSEYILSREAAPAAHSTANPSTGDSNPALGWMAALTLMSAALAILLKKKYLSR